MVQEQQLEQMKSKYQSVIDLIKQETGAQLQNVHVENGKLLIRATVPSDAAKNRIWDQIKKANPSYSSELTADIISQGQQDAQEGTRSRTAGQTYTVKSGDTLSKISQQFYGNANQYQRIFEANRDKLTDPDKIQVGQELTIPQ